MLVDLGLAPLSTLVQYTLGNVDRTPHGHFTACLESYAAAIPVVALEWGADLDRAWRIAVRSGLRGDARWCLIFNGVRLRIVDAGRPHTRRHLDVLLDLLVDDPGALGLFLALVGPPALADSPASTRRDGNLPEDRPTAGGRAAHAPTLAALVAASDAEGERVCADLRQGVHRALAAFTAALIASQPSRRGPLPLVEAYEHALTAVYRLLFLFFAEARGLVPTWHPVYREAYGMEAMRAAAELDARGLWPTFQAISRLAHAGCRAGDLDVTAFNGRLFAPSRAPLLDQRILDQASVRDALLAVSTRKASGAGDAARIAFGDLDVEELGAVYEGLLDHEPQVARDASHARAPALQVRLERTASARRKETGTFYTPRALTEYLVRETLEPLVCDRTASAILDLRIVDPAMGSGAFLVAACRYLAEQYEHALVRDGACHATDVDAADRAGFRRLVAQRCLFGVDLNPMAVQLARLSLWLTTLAADRPLTFLDHHLLVGHSLVGATLDDLPRWPNRALRRREGRQLPLFEAVALDAAVASVISVRYALETEPDDCAEQVRRKEAALASLAGGDLARWRSVCDLWCSRWFRPDRLTQPVFEALAGAMLDGGSALPPAPARRAADDTRALADAARFFHWPLEFPEVFCDSNGHRRPDSGFDAVLGNPPWEMLRDDAPPAEDSKRRDQAVRFSRESGVYRFQSSGHANAYQLFVERALWLARDQGRIGLVLPWGLATDQGTAALRHALMRQNRLEALVGFDNRRGIFPIHRSMRFMLLMATRGGETTTVRCRFGLQDPEELDAPPPAAGSRTAAVRLSVNLIERLSGEDMGIPDVRHPLDLAIAEAAVARWPRLRDPDGWHAMFGRELNASDDRDCFVRTGGLPVIEGKHIAPFRTGVVPSEWHIGRDTALSRLGPRVTRSRLAFRDVASHTNRTTLIAAIVPAWCATTHTLFCLRTPLTAADQLVLCALLNSYVANFLVRLRVSSHVTTALVANLPVPRPHAGAAAYQRLLAYARALVVGRSAVEPDLQAQAAALYGLDVDAFVHVLATFPLVDTGVRDQALRAFTRAPPR